MSDSAIFFSNNPNPMWIFEQGSLKIKAVNGAALGFYGYSEKEMLSLSITDLRPKNKVERLLDEIKKNEQGFNNSGIWLHQKKNGDKVYMQILSYPIDWGESSCKLVVAQDVTKQKDAERLLENEQEMFEVLTKNYPGTFYVFDEQGSLKRWNHNVEEVTGYTKAEVEQMTPLGFIAPSERDKVQKVIEEAFQTGGTEIETLLYTKDGEEIPFYFKASKFSLRDKPHLIGIGVDISLLKKAKKELEILYDKERKERARIESINDRLKLMNQVSNIFASELELKKVLNNIGELLVEEVSDVCSIYILEDEKPVRVTHKIVSEEVEKLSSEINKKFPGLMYSIDLFNKVIQTGKGIYQKEFTEKDLKNLGIAEGAQEMLNELGIKSYFLLPLKARDKVFGVLSLIIVQSERRFYIDDESFLKELADKISLHTTNIKMEKDLRLLNSTLEEKVKNRTVQLEEANKELESFSYSVSHDLRAPLRAIAGYSELLLEDHLQNMNEEGQEFLNIVHDETQRMGELIDELLAFSRISRTKKNEVEVSMKELVETSIQEVRNAFPNEDPQFQISNLPDIEVDPKLMKQVWLNLLGNAVKYHEPGQKQLIKVSAQLTSDQKFYVFSVSDNGVGFNMKYVDKLFGVFQRLHSDEDYEGTGIGLALAQRII
ncbi:MAG: PAS domain S-box protein, partial [Balneolaceae bacterium]